ASETAAAPGRHRRCRGRPAGRWPRTATTISYAAFMRSLAPPIRGRELPLAGVCPRERLLGPCDGEPDDEGVAQSRGSRGRHGIAVVRAGRNGPLLASMDVLVDLHRCIRSHHGLLDEAR